MNRKFPDKQWYCQNIILFLESILLKLVGERYGFHLYCEEARVDQMGDKKNLKDVGSLKFRPIPCSGY
jgi:hypothetical protein